MEKILLDHSDIRRLIRITLGRSFEVIEAEDGATGLEIARCQKPDLVVLDIMMPGPLDGMQVLDAIKADPELVNTRVIMVTAKGQASDYEAGMARGADAYFINPLQLVACIKETLARNAADAGPHSSGRVPPAGPLRRVACRPLRPWRATADEAGGSALSLPWLIFLRAPSGCSS